MQETVRGNEQAFTEPVVEIRFYLQVVGEKSDLAFLLTKLSRDDILLATWIERLFWNEFPLLVLCSGRDMQQPPEACPMQAWRYTPFRPKANAASCDLLLESAALSV